MKKPNLAVYYFKNALDRLDAQEASGQQSSHTTNWVPQSQVLYNIGISLLHAKRPAVAFDILLEVVGAHYLDPHVWYHLAECCVLAHQPDNSDHDREQNCNEVSSKICKVTNIVRVPDTDSMILKLLLV